VHLLLLLWQQRRRRRKGRKRGKVVQETRNEKELEKE
jgi:hypothetical protein